MAKHLHIVDGVLFRTVSTDRPSQGARIQMFSISANQMSGPILALILCKFNIDHESGDHIYEGQHQNLCDFDNMDPCISNRDPFFPRLKLESFLHLYYNILQNLQVFRGGE